MGGIGRVLPYGLISGAGAGLVAPSPPVPPCIKGKRALLGIWRFILLPCVAIGYPVLLPVFEKNKRKIVYYSEDFFYSEK
jgi:hypothetical protein